MKSKHVSNSQCYLILGPFENRQAKTQELLKSLNFDFSTSSPDLTIISPIKSSISIEEVRNIKKNIFQKPVESNHKVIILQDAQKLTIEAQNAFLKILEEPPIHALIILEAENQHQLLPTILSRVTKIQSSEDNKKRIENNFIDEELITNLFNLQQIEEPIAWLNEQILNLHTKLLLAISEGNINKQKQTKNAIAQCINAKKMIAANLNPKFVLANLFFSVN